MTARQSSELRLNYESRESEAMKSKESEAMKSRESETNTTLSVADFCFRTLSDSCH